MSTIPADLLKFAHKIRQDLDPAVKLRYWTAGEASQGNEAYDAWPPYRVGVWRAQGGRS